jgi:DeoR family transcriptional regulator, fructose operon transcriptional repressor
MSRTARQDQICRWIAERGECSVAQLVRRLGTSGMTVRRDLQALAERGRIIRTHGGAAMAERVSFEFEFLGRVREHQAAKQQIAAAAAAEVKDGQSVLLDSGTTTLELAKRLRAKRQLTVITTSLPIAAQLQYDRHIEVLLLGGYVRPSAPDLAGALTETNLESLRADMAFIGAGGVDRHGAVYQDSPEIARMLTKMAAAAARVFVVADHSKLGRTALCRFGRLRDWAGLITDAAADRCELAALRKAGARVIVAGGTAAKVKAKR